MFNATMFQVNEPTGPFLYHGTLRGGEVEKVADKFVVVRRLNSQQQWEYKTYQYEKMQRVS